MDMAADKMNHDSDGVDNMEQRSKGAASDFNVGWKGEGWKSERILGWKYPGGQGPWIMGNLKRGIIN